MPIASTSGDSDLFGQAFIPISQNGFNGNGVLLLEELQSTPLLKQNHYQEGNDWGIIFTSPDKIFPALFERRLIEDPKNELKDAYFSSAPGEHFIPYFCFAQSFQKHINDSLANPHKLLKSEADLPNLKAYSKHAKQGRD